MSIKEKHTPGEETADGGAGAFCLGMQPGLSPHIPCLGGSAVPEQRPHAEGPCLGLRGKITNVGKDFSPHGNCWSFSQKAIQAQFPLLDT